MIVLEGELSDEVVTVRPFEPSDRLTLLRGRDHEFHRFLGEGSAEPGPTACICVDRNVVGWIDYDNERDWLDDDEVNLGYNVFADDRGKGYATRALRLLASFLQEQVPPTRPTLLIDPANTPSLAVARRSGFRPTANIDGQQFFELDPRVLD